jgi:glycosyltransferase involved in cell wall biosynthesis
VNRVSVALCTHNGARFIGAQLRSIFEQTLLPDEIIVSDDDSTDATLEIIKREAAEHPDARITLTILENSPALGVTRNFEEALSACSGDLVALSDQDDVWHPTRLEAMVSVFDSSRDVDLIFSDARLVDAENEALGETLFAGLGITAADKAMISSGSAFAALMKRNLVTGATVMLRRELVDRARPFPASWVHDEWLAVVAAATGSVRLLDQPLIDYRQHGANVIGAGSLSFSEKVRRATEEGRERNARLVSRARELAERLETLSPPVSESYRIAARDKLAHETARSALPRARIRRPGRVVAEWRTGRYSRYGQGGADILRDLVQPLAGAVRDE